MLAEAFTRDLRRNRLQLTAVLQRSKRLGVPRFLSGEAARQEDMDDAFRYDRRRLVRIFRSLRLPQREKINERQPEPCSANRHAFTTGQQRAIECHGSAFRSGTERKTKRIAGQPGNDLWVDRKSEGW